MLTGQVLPFQRPQQAPIDEAQRGRFMIVSDIKTLDDRLEGLPDDVVAFAFRRMVREFRLGRSLDDSEAAYRLHKHARTVARLRRQHPEFLALMDGSSGHARAKFSQSMSAKSSNFWGSKPQENCHSAPPEEDSRTSVGEEPSTKEGSPTEGDAEVVALTAAGRAPPLVAQNEPAAPLTPEEIAAGFAAVRQVLPPVPPPPRSLSEVQAELAASWVRVPMQAAS